MRSVDLAPDAIAEAQDAATWYRARSLRVADEFEAALALGIEQLRQHPDLWPPYLHGTRAYQLRGFPYLLVYRILPDALQVIAVAHTSRRPGYWKKRLRS